MKFSTALVVVLSSLLQLNGAFSITQDQSALIDALVQVYISENGITGLGLSVVQNGETALAKGYGKQNIADNVDFNEDTLFAVGSVSKGVTGLLVAKTLSEIFPLMGEAVLDTPIIKLGKNLNFTLSDRFRAESVTFRDLLSHRTCLNNDNVIVQFQATNYDEFMYRSRYDTESDFGSGPLADPCTYRAGFLYNNAMIGLAGHLVGKLAGSSYRELLNKLYTQVGMNSSRVLDAEGSHEDLPNMSRAYTKVAGEIVEFERHHLRKFSAVGGAGGVLTTANDIAEYIKLHLNKGKVNGKQVVREDVMEWIHKISFPFKSANFLEIGVYGYGLGLMKGLFLGIPFMMHPGHLAPYASWLTLLPGQNDTNVGIFTNANGPGYAGEFQPVVLHFLINQIVTGETQNMQQVYSAMADLKLKTSQFNQNIDTITGFMNPKTAASPTKRNKGVSHKLRADDVVGLFGTRSHGDMRISRNADNDDNLNINYGEWGIGVLTPRSEEVNVYDVQWTTTVSYDMHAFGVDNPADLAKFSVHFVSQNDLDFDLGGSVPGGPIRFVRDATLETYPPIPWEADSCFPQKYKN